MTSVREFTTRVGLGNPPISVGSLLKQLRNTAVLNRMKYESFAQAY
jgi:hypothetical protein